MMLLYYDVTQRTAFFISELPSYATVLIEVVVRLLSHATYLLYMMHHMSGIHT